MKKILHSSPTCYPKVSLLLCIALFLGTGLSLIAPLTGYAANHVIDPQVTIIKDITPSSCIKKLTMHFGTPQAVTTQVPCPANTVLGTSVIPISKAISLHEPYVLVPPAGSSLQVQLQTHQQVQQMLEAKQKQLYSQSHSLRPSANCATDVMESSLFTTAYGDNIEDDVYWADSTDCQTLILDSADMTGKTLINSLYWNNNLYAGRVFNMDISPYFCPHIGINTVTRPINTAGLPRGYYFVSNFVAAGCTFPPSNIVATIANGPLF